MLIATEWPLRNTFHSISALLVCILLAIDPASAQDGRETLIPVQKGELYGYISQDGAVIIEPQFDHAEPFSEGLAAVRISEGTWGYVDVGGDFAIEPRYDHAADFGNGLGFVGLDGKFGFIGRGGELAIPLQFDGGSSFYGNRAAVLVDGKWGYVEPSGNFIIEPRFAGAGVFDDGLARICEAPEGEECFRSRARKFGFIDEAGRVVIPAHFDYAEHFAEGLAMARQDGLHGFIDRSGRWIIKPVFKDAAVSFSEGLALVTNADDEQLFIDAAGNTVLRPPAGFRAAHGFTDGLAMASKTDNGLWGFIDKTGDIAIPPEYERVLPFYEGRAPAMAVGKWGLIDRSGDWAVKPIYDRIDFLR